MKKDLIIIGGGPAGLAAAVAAREAGITDLIILERDTLLGGILNQCIHNGFGLHTFKEELTGPEYAVRYVKQVKELNIPYQLNTMVIDITLDKVVTAVSKENGLQSIQAKSIIFAMGCRERPRGALNIPGFRCAGIYSAGTAQKFVNIEGVIPGKEVVILGSGDIGLIMARRMTLEGAKVKVVAEIMSYSGGLKRNIVQCLEDYNIPLKLNHTLVDIKGKEHLEGVTLAEVDEHRQPIQGTEEYIPCDTLLLSVGLIPENELSNQINLDMDGATGGPKVWENFETSISGIFACGNVLHVHDLVDYVSEEAAQAGISAANYLSEMEKHFHTDLFRNISDKSETFLGSSTDFNRIKLSAVNGVRYTIPSVIRPSNISDSCTIRFRVDDVYLNHTICVYADGECISKRKKRILTPGEMETIVLTKAQLEKHSAAGIITICLEKGEIK